VNKKALNGWFMYDWANSAFATTMLAAVFPIFYKEVPGAALEGNLSTSYLGYTNSIAMLCVALLSPVLGAIADMSGRKMRFLRLFAYMGIVATALTVFVGKGDWMLASALFVVATVGFSGGNTFYDALLPDLAPYEKRDMVSAKGFMYGYIGGGVLLALNLAMIQMPQMFGLPDTLAATRAAFASVAVWWLLFSLPLFRSIKDEPKQNGLGFRHYAHAGFGRIWNTLRHIRRYPELLKYIIAFWLFNDGISTVIIMATAYGKDIGIGTPDLIAALLITQFVGIPSTYLFGTIAQRLGSKPSLYISLSIYILIIGFGYFMTNAAHFYALACVVGLVQGGSQSIARSIYSKLVPLDRSAEFFGFLSVSSKFSAVFGPFTFALVGQLTGSSRLGILSLIFFFAAGIAMLTKVNLEKGRIEAGR
jgi:UMF1 family MFS transporter